MHGVDTVQRLVFMLDTQGRVSSCLTGSCRGLTPLSTAVRWGQINKMTGSSGNFVEARDERFRGEAFSVRKNALKAQHNLALGNAQGVVGKRTTLS